MYILFITIKFKFVSLSSPSIFFYIQHQQIKDNLRHMTSIQEYKNRQFHVLCLSERSVYVVLGVSRVQHDYVLAWTSLWILVPFLTWFSSGFVFAVGSHVVPWYVVLLLPFSCGISIKHWLHNMRGSIVHRLDMSLSTLSITTHIWFLVFIERAFVAYCLGLALVFFFALARLTKQNYTPNSGHVDIDKHMHINWGGAMIFHTIFRYFAFWITMYSHSYSINVLNSMDFIQWLWFVMMLTSLYVISIVLLVLRS